MTLEHIKQLRLLIEQAQTPSSDEFMMMVMEKISQHLSASDSPGGRAEWIDEWLYDMLSSDAEMLSQAQALGLEKNLTTWKWINQEFKHRMGQSLVNFELAAQRGHHDAAAKAAPEDQKQLLNMISNQMTFKLSPRDVKDLAWYSPLRKLKNSSETIVILMPEDTNVPAAQITDSSVKALGMTWDKLKALLSRMGINQIAAPPAFKSRKPYYD